jgi:ankyrin repeat protein
MRGFDEALSRNYIMWTSDLYLIPGLSSEWLELGVPKYALHLAVWFRPDQVQKLLSRGHYVDEPDMSQHTPLSYACTKGCLTSVEVLLRAGARLEADSWRESPLGFAIRNDHIELTRMLLEANTNLCARSDAEGLIPLMLAKSLRMVHLLCGVHDFDMNATDWAGRSILIYVGVGATHLDSNPEVSQILEYLIHRGASIYTKSKAGMDLVDYAASRLNGDETLRFLLQRDPSLIDKEAHEWTPLHWACRNGIAVTAETLLEHGSKAKKITTHQPPRSWTPYEILMHYGEPLGWSFDEIIRRAIGQPEDARISAGLLPQEQIECDSLEVTETGTNIKCSLCTMPVYVCDPMPYSFLLPF